MEERVVSSTTFLDNGTGKAAGREILHKEGSLISVQKNFVWELFSEFRRTVCYRCNLTPVPTTARCSGCKWARYCSKECQTNDWIDRHKEECRLLRQKEFYEHDHPQRIFVILVHKAIIKLMKEGPDSDFYQLPMDEDQLPNTTLQLSQQKPLSFEANFRIIRMFDPEGLVCPDSTTYCRIFTRILRNSQSTVNWHCDFGYDREDGCTVGTTLKVSSKPVAAGKSCLANAVGANFGGDNRPRPTLVMAVRDIYVGEEILVSAVDVFCSKLQRLDFLKKTGKVCTCPACIDPAVEAERTSLKCKNDRCLEAIPSDERANQPCPNCSEINKSRLKEGKSLMKNLNKFYHPSTRRGIFVAHACKGPIEVIRSFIAEGEKVLHSTNIFMGILYFDAADCLQDEHNFRSQEWLDFAMKSIPAIELHVQKYHLYERTIYTNIVTHHLVKGNVEPAIPFAKILLERGKIYPGIDTVADKLHEQLWKDLMQKPEPKIDKFLLEKLRSGCFPSVFP